MVKKDNKTFAVTFRFWTNDLKVSYADPDKKRKSCWNCGTAILEANKTLGIKSDAEVFNNFEDMVASVKTLFRRNMIFPVDACRKRRLR